MAENNRLTYIVAIAGILLFVVLSVAFLHFWNQSNSATSIDAYTISVKGLDDYKGLIGDVIIVPLPVRNGKEVFSDKDLQYQKFGNWTSVLVMTKDGKMLGFQTNTGDLSNLQARFYKSSGEADFNTLDDTTLLPGDKRFSSPVYKQGLQFRKRQKLHNKCVYFRYHSTVQSRGKRHYFRHGIPIHGRDFSGKNREELSYRYSRSNSLEYIRADTCQCTNLDKRIIPSRSV